MKKRELQLSIIIPVYNVKKYLDNCIMNLINNNYLNKYEIILVDDGSTDGSGRLCDVYANEYSMVKVFHQNNRGQSYARNFGISKSRGKWITFIDSDDIVISDYINLIMSLITHCTFDVIMFKYEIFSEDKRSSSEKKKFDISQVMKINKDKAMFYLTLDQDWGNYLWNKIYKRSLFEYISLPVNQKYEDIATLYKVIDKAHTVCVYNEVLYFYRQRQNSTVHSRNREYLIDEIRARQAQLLYFKKHNYQAAYKMANHFLLFSYIGYIKQFHSSDDKITKMGIYFVKNYKLDSTVDDFKTKLKVVILKIILFWG